MNKYNSNLKNNIPYLKATGTPRQIGKAHGEAYSHLIQNLFNTRYDLLKKYNKSSKNKIIPIANSLWNYICDFDKNIAIEVESTAKASNLQPWQLVVAGGFTDLMDALLIGEDTDYHECTVAIDPVKGFIAGTWDSHPEAEDALILLERHPQNGPATLALTTAGWPCQQGINSNGVAFAITNLTPTHATEHGLVYIAANAALGMANSTSGILDRLKEETYCSGHSYLILDKTGTAAILETTYQQSRILPVKTLTTKANHYYSDAEFIDDNSNYAYCNSSIIRENELLNNVRLLENPDDFPDCLFKSPNVNRTGESQTVKTCAHFFISVKQKKIWYSKGPALASSEHTMVTKTLN